MNDEMSLMAGRNGIAGRNEMEFDLKYPNNEYHIPLGEVNKKLRGMRPDEVYKAKYTEKEWGLRKEKQKESGVRSVPDKIVQEEYTRANQNGLKASTGVHGFPWFDVSGISAHVDDNKQLPAEQINIQGSAYKYGQAILPKDFGKDLGASRVLQRAPNTLVFTEIDKHRGETIQDVTGAGGAGRNLLKRKM